jgi:uncharacterized membrane protein YfcA
MTNLLIALIVFLAIFLQSFAGFGLALVAMPLLVSVVDLEVAAPLVALIAATAGVFLLLHYRAALNLQAVKQLIIASLIGIPLGMVLLGSVNEQLVLPVLGIIVTGYALYVLLGPHLPRLVHPGWAYGFGFVAGLLHGAYNIPGPPAIVYGTCRRWQPAEFKGNLQGFFMPTGLLVVMTHLAANHYTGPVLSAYLIALPAMALGMVAGFALEKRVDAERFRQVVLILLAILGITLIV